MGKLTQWQNEILKRRLFSIGAFGPVSAVTEVLRQLSEKDCCTMHICSSESEVMKHSSKHQARIICCDDLEKDKRAKIVMRSRQLRANWLEFFKNIKHNAGVPCHHRGCLQHISHPCEGCGRIAGEYPNYPAIIYKFKGISKTTLMYYSQTAGKSVSPGVIEFFRKNSVDLCRLPVKNLFFSDNIEKYPLEKDNSIGGE